MAPPKPGKRAVKPKLVAPQPLTQATLASAFLTDGQLDQLGLDPATAAVALADASGVYGQVNANPYVTREQLLSWAQSAWGGGDGAVDRLNSAIAFLEAAGKLAAVNVG